MDIKSHSFKTRRTLSKTSSLPASSRPCLPLGTLGMALSNNLPCCRFGPSLFCLPDEQKEPGPIQQIFTHKATEDFYHQNSSLVLSSRQGFSASQGCTQGMQMDSCYQTHTCCPCPTSIILRECYQKKTNHSDQIHCK